VPGLLRGANRADGAGVLLRECPMALMTGYVDGLDKLAGAGGRLIDVERELEREFEARLAECSTLAFRLAYSVLRHRQDAEDVAQDAFAKAHRKFSQLRERDRFRAWLARMTWRLAIDRQRANRRRAAHEAASGAPPAPGTIPDDIHARERAEALWKAIDALPDKLRIVVVLANMEGHSLDDVGKLLDVPEGTIKWRVSEARRQLKEQLSWMQTDRTR